MRDALERLLQQKRVHLIVRKTGEEQLVSADEESLTTGELTALVGAVDQLTDLVKRLGATTRGRPAPAARRTVLREDLSTLVQPLSELARSRPSWRVTPSVDERSDVAPNEFARALSVAMDELDRRRRYTGLIPIAALRDEMRGLGLSDQAFNAALLEQERLFHVDLKAAHDPRSVGDPEAGIRDEGRGILLYAVKR